MGSKRLTALTSSVLYWRQLPQGLTRSITRSRSNRPAGRAGFRAFRTFHAFHLPDHRTDPRPAAAGGLARGAASGGAVADRAVTALSKPARRACNRARLWPGIPGGNRSRSAAGVLARRHRVSRRRQSHVRRLSAGAALRGRYVLDAVSAGARHCRRATGGARGSPEHDGRGIQFARPRIRPAGAGASALGALADAFMAVDRPEPAQRVVRMVDRSRTFAADDLGCDRPVAAGRRICARDRCAGGAC